MKITRQILSDLPPRELNRIIQMGQEIIQERNNNHKKELWDDVVAAICKYESEIGDIVIDDGDRQGFICSDCLDYPGFLIIVV